MAIFDVKSPGCEEPGCPGPRDTIKRTPAGIRYFCYGCAGPIRGGPPPKPAVLEALAAAKAEAEADEESEPEQEVEAIAAENGRKCVGCGGPLSGRERKRCGPCRKIHWNEYQRNYAGARAEKRRAAKGAAGRGSPS